MVKRDLYVSVDVETDGPIPGPYSMLSFGLALAGRFDGHSFSAVDPERVSFYRELQPISDMYLPEAVAVTALDREELIIHGTEPHKAMADAKHWVEELAETDRPVLVGYPLIFDWMFIYWYFETFSERSPFDFSSGLDMKTMYQQKARVPLSLAGKEDLPGFLRSNRPHTHNARDDAIEQADIFVKLFEWTGV
jgi:hypothetical protein